MNLIWEVVYVTSGYRMSEMFKAKENLSRSSRSDGPFMSYFWEHFTAIETNNNKNIFLWGYLV